MPELLVEILCEEIPARMQARAAADLERLLGERLTAAGLAATRVRTLVGPRRLAIVADGLPARSADVREEKKGPRVDAPKQAIEGFLRSVGLTSVDRCEVREDKKGAYYVALIERPGVDSGALIAGFLPELLREFPWPKSMRWGEGGFRWVRPIHRILCVLDGEVLAFEAGGVASGDQTEGHRLLGRGPFRVRSFKEYVAALEGKGGIVLDAAKRREIILADAKARCAEAGLELVEDAGLLEEVGGLVERPVVLLGDMDPSFLDLPPEVIRLTMRTHQRYFAVRNPESNGLAPKFVVVANQPAPDGGKAIAAGAARVLSARLNDARYFWDQDRKIPLAKMAEGLKDIVFHAKLGSVADKVDRVAALARELAPSVGADPDLADKAARLAKADLVSGMVGEFPELQGVMGRYYARLQAGLDPLAASASPPPLRGRGRGGGAESAGAPSPDERSTIAAPHPLPPPRRGEGEALSPEQAALVADAIRDHYKPLGPSDSVPTEPTAVAVALADKLDTLVGFWAIDEKPTGSKDPYALRRAALGFIRIALAAGARIRLRTATYQHFNFLRLWPHLRSGGNNRDIFLECLELAWRPSPEALMAWSQLEMFQRPAETEEFTATLRVGDRNYSLFYPNAAPTEVHFADLFPFFADRLKVTLRDEGHRHDLVDAVFALDADDLVLIVKRVEALGRFLDTSDGTELLAAYRRASNIVRDEEKKDSASYADEPDPKLLREREEQALHAGLTEARAKVEAAVKREDFAAAMAALAPLRPAIDAFFDKVMVNVPDQTLRANRLRLLARFRDALSGVADFSKIAG